MNLIISTGRKGVLCSCVLSLLPAKLQLFILLRVLLQSNSRCQSLLGFKNDFNFLRGLERVSGLICCLRIEALVLWPLSVKDKLRVTVCLFRSFVNIENQLIQISFLLETLLFL